MKIYDVIGLGNALVDILMDVSEEEFAPLGLPRGTHQLVTAEEQKALLARVGAKKPSLISGGSVANSMVGLSQLGAKTAFMTSIGDDKYGLYYASEFESSSVALVNAPAVGGVTGTVAIFVTPDSERTMRTCLAVSSELSERHVDAKAIEQSRWLFIEGYVFANPEWGHGAIRKAIKDAKASGCKIAITCSEAWAVNAFPDAVHAAIADADLVFTNEVEACTLTGAQDAKAAFAALGAKVPNVVVTGGAHGAWVRWEGSDLHVEAFRCEPRDLTGAGDMFAGAFLYGVTQGIDPRTTARCSCYLAMQVITRMGARINSGTKEFWDTCAAGAV